MELEKTVIQAKPVTLSEDDQEAIKTFILENWEKGKAERTKYIDHAKKCEDAYHCVMPPIESPELDWMSNKCLPWAYDASESWFAHIHSTTIPKNDQIFTISGRTEEDHPGADVMQKYLEYCFERNHYPKQLGRAIKNLSISNHACLKVFWKEETTIVYNWVDEPVMQDVMDEVSGQVFQIQTGTKKVRKPQEIPAFNGVWIDVVDIKNFVMYPIHGDINKTTRIHETYRHYEDLMASAKANETNYFNLDRLSLDDEKEVTNNERREEKDKKQPQGLNIKEAWIHRIKIGDKVYRNFVATLVNNKTIVRFQPFPPGCPKSPFVWMALRPDGDCLYGYGLNSKGLGILESANQIFNSWQDEINLTQHNAYKYYEDGTFNPNNVVRRPGAMIKMTQQSVQDNLIPLIDDLSKQQQAMVDLQALKVEFETVTVPKVVKGMIETERESTATEQTLAQNNSSGKMHIDAFNVNDGLIQPTLELSYQAIYDRLQFDDAIVEDMTKITQPKDPEGNPLGQLPVLPLPQVDVKVVGYQNVIRKQEQLAAAGQAIPQLAESPAGKYLKWDNIGEDIIRLMELDKDRWLQNDDERKQTDEAEQQAGEAQQKLLEEKELGPVRNQQAKQEQEFQLKSQQQQMDFQLKQAELQIKQTELLIKQQELALKQQEMELKEQQQEHNEQMGLHSAAMSERNQAFSEEQALKENKEDKK